MSFCVLTLKEKTPQIENKISEEQDEIIKRVFKFGLEQA
jgi:hypothetical protein